MLYKGDKDVNATARSPTRGPAEAGDFWALSLPSMDFQCCSSLTQRWPSRTQGLLGLKSAKAWPLKVWREVGRGRSDSNRNSSPVGFSWSSVHFVQCGPDERSWTWTQIWVQARMPKYSLNWTARPSAIQGWQRCLWCSPPTRRWPSRSLGPFGLKSATEHWLSGTDARQSAGKQRLIMMEWDLLRIVNKSAL